jgi:UDP-glucose 4-epimerase
MAERKKRVFVTGGRGRLATLIKSYLDPQKYEVTLFSRTPGKGYEDVKLLFNSDYLKKSDYVFHLSWTTVPSIAEMKRSPWNTSEDYHNVRLLTQHATESGTKLVFFSTGAVYGEAIARTIFPDGSELYVQKDESLTYMNPIGWYAQAKLFAERIVSQAPDHLNLRITNPYGKYIPNGRNQIQGIIPMVIQAAIKHETLRIWGDGRATKDFIYYLDFIRAIEAILEDDLVGTYNVCSGRSYSINDIIRQVSKETNTEITIEYCKPPDWDVKSTHISNYKLWIDTGWSPIFEMDAGIAASVEDLKHHIQ